MLKLGTGGAPVNALKLSTPHLDATAVPSDGEVAVGNRFTIALDVTPKPGIHVYAPGAAAYRVITLAIAEQPAIRVLPIRYPPSEVYVFAPLNERVAVYQRPFRLLREIVVEGTPQAQAALRGQTALTIGAPSNTRPATTRCASTRLPCRCPGRCRSARSSRRARADRVLLLIH